MCLGVERRLTMTLPTSGARFIALGSVFSGLETTTPTPRHETLFFSVFCFQQTTPIIIPRAIKRFPAQSKQPQQVFVEQEIGNGWVGKG